MAKYKKTLLLLILASFLLGVSLAPMHVFAAESSGNAIEIERCDYYIENIHPGYWEGKFNPDEPRLYITFYVYIKNLEKCIDNIKKVQVYDSTDKPWSIDLEKNTDESMRYIGGGTNFYDDTLSNNGSVLFLKDYRAVITTKDNEKITKVFTVCEPGMKEGTSKKYIYSEDYRGKKDDSYAEALKWGKIDSVGYQHGTFDVKFAINDGRTANARLEFYDKNKKYLGETHWFINSYSKEVFTSLNNGSKLYIDGQMNSVQVKTMK